MYSASVRTWMMDQPLVFKSVRTRGSWDIVRMSDGLLILVIFKGIVGYSAAC